MNIVQFLLLFSVPRSSNWGWSAAQKGTAYLKLVCGVIKQGAVLRRNSKGSGVAQIVLRRFAVKQGFDSRLVAPSSKQEQ